MERRGARCGVVWCRMVRKLDVGRQSRRVKLRKKDDPECISDIDRLMRSITVLRYHEDTQLSRCVYTYQEPATYCTNYLPGHVLLAQDPEHYSMSMPVHLYLSGI